jgi:hypothetical protein
MKYRGKDVSAATTRHALQIVARAVSTPAGRLEVSPEDNAGIPCRAVGVARAALDRSGHDRAAAQRMLVDHLAMLGYES